MADHELPKVALAAPTFMCTCVGGKAATSILIASSIAITETYN